MTDACRSGGGGSQFSPALRHHDARGGEGADSRGSECGGKDNGDSGGGRLHVRGTFWTHLSGTALQAAPWCRAGGVARRTLKLLAERADTTVQPGVQPRRARRQPKDAM